MAVSPPAKPSSVKRSYKRKNGSQTHKGLYNAKNPQKYLGDPRKIRFMSSWELRFMTFCDTNPHIIAWGSEEFRIPYFNPVKKRMTTYIPDFIIKYRDKTGQVVTEVIEIKPKKQAVISSKMSLYDKVQLVINQAKWQAAVGFCKQHGINFRILTEDQMFR